MPRYSSYDPLFDPIDFKTRIAPTELYREEYNKQSDKLDDMATLASAIAGSVPDGDEYRAVIDDYNANLANVADELLKTGNIGNLRNQLRGLKQAYAEKLVPIKDAADARLKDIETFDKNSLDPDFVGVDPRRFGLKDYMAGNRPKTYATNVKNITADILGEAKAFAQRLRRDYIDGDFMVTEEGLDENTLNELLGMLSEGRTYSAEDFADAGVDNPEVAAEYYNDILAGLNRMVEKTYQKYGLDAVEGDTVEDIINQERVNGALLSGLKQGLTYDKKYTARPANVRVSSGGSGRSGSSGSGDTIDQFAALLPYKTVKKIVDVNGNVITNGSMIKDIADITYKLAFTNRELWDKPTSTMRAIGTSSWGAPQMASGSGPSPKETVLKIAQKYGISEKDVKDLTEIPDLIKKKVANQEAFSTHTTYSYDDNNIAGFVEKVNKLNSSIADNNVSAIVDEDGNRVSQIPLSSNEKSTVSVSYNHNAKPNKLIITGADGKKYYVSFDLFEDARYSLGDKSLSAKELAKLYNDAMKNNDYDLAGQFGDAMMWSLYSWNNNVAPKQPTSFTWDQVTKANK